MNLRKGTNLGGLKGIKATAAQEVEGAAEQLMKFGKQTYF